MWRWRRRSARDFSQEIEAHIVLDTDRLIADGMSPEDARAAALRTFGNVTRAEERFYESRRVMWLDDLQRDVRYALRGLIKSPGFTAVAVFILALGIGANTAIFSAVYAVLLKPLPIRQPNDLVICWGSDRPHNLAIVELSYRNFQDWAAHARSFSQLAAVGSSTWPAVVDGQGEFVRLSSAGVSVSFFDTLGVIPEIGRSFRPDDDVPQADRVVVLSHGMWVRRFGADPRAVGTTIQLDADAHRIVGVMPAGFDFPRGTDFWTPVVPILADSAQGWRPDHLETVGVLFVIGRLHDGVTPQVARDELDRLAGQFERNGVPRFGSAVVVTPFLNYLLGPVRQALWALLAGVGVLLLISCANVSGLMLTRGSLRRREHAVRLALGATGGAVARHWLLETLTLSVIGGVLGLTASQWITKVIVALAPDDVPRLTEITINLPVAAFTFGVVLTTALLCGTGPIRYARALNLVEALNDAARSTPGKRTYQARSLLLILQLGLSVVLLVAAGLVARSVLHLRSLDLGFVPSNVMTLTVGPRNPKPSANQWVHELLRRVSALPDVEAAGAVYLRPLALGPIGQETSVVLEGQPDTPQSERENPALNYQVATPGYFSAMHIQLKHGRLLNEEDTANTIRVVLIGETTARRLWPGESAVNRRMLMPTFEEQQGPPKAWRTVVGVVSDVRYRGLDDVRLDVYDAALQSPTAATDLVVRTSGDPLRVVGAVQAEARRLDPRVVVDRLTTMDAIVSRAIAPWSFSVWMFTAFAAVAVVLAAAGLFSLVSLDVAQRHREFAIRIALGAQQADIVRPVLRAAGRRVIAGVFLGMLIAVGATRGIQSLLFGVEALDVTTYSAVVALVFAVVVIASCLPTYRATKVDPMVALRCE